MASEAAIYLPTVEQNLFGPLQPIYGMATDDSSYIMNNGKTVYIPYAGAHSTFSIGSTSYPNTIQERADGNTSYDLSNLEINPTRLGRFEGNNASYNKAESLIHDVTKGLGWYAFRYIMKEWYHATNAVSSSDTANTYTNIWGKAAIYGWTVANVLTAAAILDKQKVPRDGNRWLVIDAYMYSSLLADIGITTYRDSIYGFDNATGMITKLAGFNVLVLPEVAHRNASGTIQNPDYSTSNTSESVGYAFHKDFVSFAVGGVNLYYNAGVAEYYGDLISGDVFTGGSYRRNDKAGIVALLEETA